MVAKIYDPLYYSDSEDGFEQDFVLAAQGDYGREAAAYHQLQKSPAARDVTPAFYGTWTAKIATSAEANSEQQTRTRVVRLILIEYLRGECMQYVDPYELRRGVRSRILKKVLDAESIIMDPGVRHRDCHPRNVILLGSVADASKLEVKILDFNIAGVMEIEGNEEWLDKLKQQWPGKLSSPIVLYYGVMMNFIVYGWCSSEDMEAEKWLWKHYKDDERYFPVSWHPEDPLERPEYQEARF